MVRRRTRATAGSKLTVEGALVNGKGTSLPNGQLFEDHYFASPKRKDCKVEEESKVESACKRENEASVRPKTKSQNSNKVKSESAGGVTGVPLATRSQTRTIDNFFKVSATAAKAKSKGADDPTTHTDCTLPPSSSPPHIEHGHKCLETEYPTNCEHHSLDKLLMPSEIIFDLSEDTNDSERTDFSDELRAAVVEAKAIGFCNYRSSARADSHSSSHSSTNMSATENIFLQEPVLTLNIDKSPNQASSIKINKSLEVEPVFSSPPALSATVLNGCFNQIVSLAGSPTKRNSFCCETNSMFARQDYGLVTFPENDNSSCDSGVALGAIATVDNGIDVIPHLGVSTADPQNRSRKPATPHRIVCPSPIKAALRNVSPAIAVKDAHSPSNRKKTSTLSPRKAHRHQSTTSGAATGSKTRRRLNQHKEQTPYSTTNTTTLANDEANGYEELVDPLNDNDGVAFVDKGKKSEYKHEISSKSCAIGHLKTLLNSAKQESSQQNCNNKTGNQLNNIKESHTVAATKTYTKSKYTVGRSQQSALKHQGPQPLAATNGNREIHEFFPVRRSVRKTKTAVKEEMMRNLEQAILEERSEGLKIAHFEGKGRGVVAERRFQRGEFVVEYVGDLISTSEAAERERRYALDENAGCYMYYFKHKNQQYCIDATVDTGKLGRLVNHSRNGNLITKVVVVKQRPHLILIAKDDIEPGEELSYDYGDRSKESLLHHPWLAF